MGEEERRVKKKAKKRKEPSAASDSDHEFAMEEDKGRTLRG